MEVVSSFTIDHTCLKPGIYISRLEEDFVTFDIRMTEPNKEPAVAPSAMHTLEHLMATWLRNEEGVKESVVYVGPMGCLTGMYVIMRPGFNEEDMRSIMIRCLEWIEKSVEEVPATTPQTCGNCLLHDLPMAKWEARRYRERLINDFHSQYTPLQVYLDNGMKFADA